MSGVLSVNHLVQYRVIYHFLDSSNQYHFMVIFLMVNQIDGLK